MKWHLALFLLIFSEYIRFSSHKVDQFNIWSESYSKNLEKGPKVRTIVGFLVIILVPVSVAAVEDILIRRIPGRQIKKGQTEWERAIFEVRSKVRLVI